MSRRPGARGSTVELRFSQRELLDLGAAWLALGLAFTLFLFGPAVLQAAEFVPLMAISLATVGVAFLLHELAHKVVAIRFDQIAEFRADYGMLFLAVMSGIVGFLFAAPGAVHHRGRITPREHGLIALAGPVTNLLLAGVFLSLSLVVPFGHDVSPGISVWHLGVGINVFLAAFNMVPFGPLDGRTVLGWSKAVFAGAFGVSVGLLVLLYTQFGGII